jgi:pimeloyl-ACP methyl ester carboxylesterase
VTSLAYDDTGSGEPVLFIAGTAGAGRTWHIHQVPVFLAAGYRCLTFDNRGIGATEDTGGFTTEQMVADTAELIETVIGGPTRVVAMSMGAFIAQELMLAYPELVRQTVLMGTRGRVNNAAKRFRDAEIQLINSGIELPAAYEAKVRILENFSPKTINDEVAVIEWMEMFTEDGVYWMPAAPEQTDWESQPSIFAEDKLLMQVRANRLLHPNAWSQAAQWATHHLLGTTLVEQVQSGSVSTYTAFQMMEVRRDKVRHFGGSYRHHWVQQDGHWKIRLQRVDMFNAQASYDYVIQAWI